MTHSANGHGLTALPVPQTATATAGTSPGWPASFPAHRSAVSGSAVREVPTADADAVFAWLMRVDLHGAYYPQLRRVRRLRGPWPQLQRGSAFSMFIGALAVPYVRVIEADPERRTLSWGIRTPLLSICHAFSVHKGERGALLRSDEAAAGPLARLLAPVLRRPLQRIQDDWTDALVRALVAHPDGPPAS